MLRFALHAQGVNVFLGDGGGIKAFFFHNDGFLLRRFAVFQILDDALNVGGLERVALAVIVPVAGFQLFQRPFVAVKAHHDDVFAYTVGDVGFIQRLHGTFRHVVVFRIDHIELFAGVDDRLHDLLRRLGVPFSGLLGHDVPVFVGGHFVVQRAAAAHLRGGTHGALNVDHIVGVQFLRSEPFHRGGALFRHIRHDGSRIQAFVRVDGAVKQDDLDTGVLRILQHRIPTGGAGGGDQQVIDFVLNEFLSGSDLLIVLQAVRKGRVVAILFGEGGFQVFVVGGAIAGLVGVVVDDADFDQIAVTLGTGLVGGAGVAAARLRTGTQRKSHNQGEQ